MSEQRRTGIILGEYKGLQVPGFDRTITDEDVMESLRRLQAQGITMDQYLSMTQETMEGLHRQVHPSAEQKVQAELVLEAVAETEGLDVTEEEVEVAVAQLAAQYQVNLAAMKNALDMDALRQNLRINKAASLIADSAVEIF